MALQVFSVALACSAPMVFNAARIVMSTALP